MNFNFGSWAAAQANKTTTGVFSTYTPHHMDMKRI